MSAIDAFVPQGILCTEGFVALSDRLGGAVVLMDYEGREPARYEGFSLPSDMLFYDGRLYVVTRSGIEQIDTTAAASGARVVVTEVPDAITLMEERLVAAYGQRVVYYDLDDFSETGSVQTGVKAAGMSSLSGQLWLMEEERGSLVCLDDPEGLRVYDIALEAPRAITVGKYGDGCGGGRLFMVDGNAVKVYNPDDGNMMTLMEGISHPTAIDKKGCSLYIAHSGGVTRFNLSEMKEMKFL